MEKTKNRIGETNINNQGLKMTIVKYVNSNNIDVEFEDGFVVTNRQYRHFQNGGIRNPYNKDVWEIGFTGIGKYKASENGKHTKLYTVWKRMLERCYSEKYQKRQPTYIGCSVCEEWHNYQVFAKWFEDNVWDKDFTVLDKDILIKYNKEYSSNTCVLVDNRINTLFVKSDKHRGQYPIGVYYNKRDRKFRATCSIVLDGKKQQKYLGGYNTLQEAFNVYKQFKENYIKQVADEYNSKYENFPNKLYKAMYDYKVEIDD